MAVSRVDFYGNPLIDITDTTATPAVVSNGTVFYQADGTRAVGTAPIEPIVVKETIALSPVWTGSDPYEQVVISGDDERYMVDVQPTMAQTVALINAGAASIQAVNDNGDIKVICTGGHPTEAMTLQITKTLPYEPLVTRQNLTLSADWSGSDPYTQVILPDDDARYMVDVQLTPEQITALTGAGVKLMQTENVDGTVSLVCIGGHPTEALSVQITKTTLY